MIRFDHQAYVIVGSRDNARDLVCRSCESFLGNPLVGYNDFNEFVVSNFGIDEARELRTKQQRVGFNSNKFFLVVTDSITHEAQNALLKTLEEPTADTFIFIVVPSAQSLLPTLLSRVAVINLEKGEGEISDVAKLATEFLNTKPADRFELIENIIGKEHPDRARAREFVAKLAKAFRQKYSPEKWTSEQTFAAGELIKAERYLGEPASLAKMILEHLALILPV